MLTINTNLSSLIVQGNLQKSTDSLNLAIERMTTGYKINHASDNAANYSISTNMDTKIGAYQIAEENVSMGIDLVTTASDSVQEMQNKAERLRSLCVQAKNGTYGAQSLSAITAESNAIVAEINRIFSTAKYNGISLFSNTTGSSQVVAQAEATPEVATFGLTRSANSDGKFIDDPVTYTDEEIEAMLASGDIVVLDNNVTTFTSGQKYLISDETQLARLASLVKSDQTGSGATFILGADIDLGSYCDQEIANGNGGWAPIGSTSHRFGGTFDGNGHVIKDLKIDRDATFQGLFGRTASGSEIKNLGIEGGSVKGEDNVGALVGYSHSSSISNCYATGTVTGADSVGGLVGYADSSISNCYATGEVIGTGNTVGGLVGDWYDSSYDSFMSNCYATGSVIGTGNVGGLVGTSSHSSISNCYATGSVIGTGNNVGGLVGNSSSHSSISNCYATGSVRGVSYVGGLVGASSSVINSYATGSVNDGSSYAGGLVGNYGSGTFTNNASVQTDTKATQMTEEEILAVSNLESMGFTEDKGWTIENGVPIIALKYAAQSSEDDSNVSGDPSGDAGAGDGSGTGDGSVNGSTGGAGGASGVIGGGTGGFAIVLQVGIYGNGSSQIGFDINLSYDLSPVLADISSDEALDAIDNFINLLSEKQTHFGSVQNRLLSVLDEITIQQDNLISSLSTIRDADMAEISSQYIQQQILQQASATLLATANQTPALALQLL